jgi:hypothetical protein
MFRGIGRLGSRDSSQKFRRETGAVCAAFVGRRPAEGCIRGRSVQTAICSIQLSVNSGAKSFRNVFGVRVKRAAARAKSASAQ